MTAEDRPRFAKALALMAETLGQPLSDLRVEGYFAALRDLDIDAVLAGIEQALKAEQYPVLPTPGKIREYAGATRQDAAVTAWDALGQAIRSFGYYRQPELPVDVLTACQAVYGSWQSACSQMPARHERGYEDHRRRFLLAYALREHHRAALPSSATVRQLKAAP